MGPPPSVRLAQREYKTPLPAEAPAAAPASAAFRFRVVHASRVRIGSVETVHVSLEPLHPLERMLDIGPRKSAPPCLVRVLVPGALVAPADHAVEPSPSGPVDVPFYITPLAEGDLPDARVEVLRDGRVESLPIHLHSDSPRTMWIGILLALLIALLLFLPTCWPEAANGAVERALTTWLPQLPGISPTLARLGQGFYTFLATTGKDASLSFIALFGMLLALGVWAFMRRPEEVTVVGEEFSVPLTNGTKTPPSVTPVPENGPG
jgi:hypothetical protein